MRERSETISKESRGNFPETVRSLYYLRDPRTNEIKYVGSTNDPSRRLIQHISETKHNMSTQKHHWIKSLLRRNMKPLIEVFYTSYDTDEVMRLENWIILRSPLHLLNHKDHAISKRVLTNKVNQYTLEGAYLETYCNATQAHHATGVHDSQILRCCKQEASARTAGGYQWSFKLTANLGEVKPPKVGKPVTCIETNTTYKSGRTAARETGVCYKRISACLNKRQKTAGGFHWKW